MSMWGSSMWVGKAHSTNQVPNLRTYGWTACAAPTLPPPIEPTPLAMPGDDGRRLTMSRADRQAFHSCESQTKRTRSAQRNGAFDRGSNAAGRERISAFKAARVRNPADRRRVSMAWKGYTSWLCKCNDFSM